MTLTLKLEPTTHHIEVEYQGEKIIFVFKDVTKRTPVHFYFRAQKGQEHSDELIKQHLKEIKGVIDESGNKWKPENVFLLPAEITNEMITKFDKLLLEVFDLKEGQDDAKKQDSQESSENS